MQITTVSRTQNPSVLETERPETVSDTRTLPAANPGLEHSRPSSLTAAHYDSPTHPLSALERPADPINMRSPSSESILLASRQSDVQRVTGELEALQRELRAARHCEGLQSRIAELRQLIDGTLPGMPPPSPQQIEGWEKEFERLEHTFLRDCRNVRSTAEVERDIEAKAQELENLAYEIDPGYTGPSAGDIARGVIGAAGTAVAWVLTQVSRALQHAI